LAHWEKLLAPGVNFTRIAIVSRISQACNHHAIFIIRNRAARRAALRANSAFSQGGVVGKNVASEADRWSMKCLAKRQGRLAQSEREEEKAVMSGKSVGRMGAACVVCLSFGLAAQTEAADPPYAILLRSRDALVTPERSKDAQTGGGFIQVTQVEPNVVMALMRGAVVAGTGHKEGSAAMQFLLNQDFEIVATRAGLRPPRLVVAAWAIGALDSTLREGGTAEQSPACASVRSGGETILNLSIKPHGVGGGENLLVNDRVGPIELVVAPGGFCLHQTFALNAAQAKAHCLAGSAAAHFDPDPKLDSQWNDVLKPFRAVPHRDFGFRVILRVVEDPQLPGATATPPPGELPPPKEARRAEPILNEENAPR
jgi:hypothetical protein